eukprot:5321223-Amphidinium_carterae.1
MQKSWSSAPVFQITVLGHLCLKQPWSSDAISTSCHSIEILLVRGKLALSSSIAVEDPLIKADVWADDRTDLEGSCEG